MNEMHLTEVEFDPFASELARVVPTTEAQREVWLADQLGRDASLSYNESVTLTFKGRLDLNALQQALLALSDRHEALRSTFSEDGTSLMISARGDLQARVVVLESMPEAEKVGALAAARIEAVSDAFDLAHGPLIRATLFAVGPEQNELILTAHHIVCDGWSFGIIARELMTLYQSFASGTPATPALPPADSFGDYAMAQLEAAYQAQADADTQWWVRQYDGSLPVLELPTDRPRQAFRSFDSLREDLVIDAAVVDGLRKLGQKNGASLFVTMFGLFGGLMGRLSNQDDIVLGVPAAGQASDGLSTLVGHCVQLLPIRLAAGLEQPIPDLIKATRTRVLDAYEHQACTYGQLLKKLRFERNPGRLPLVSVLFNLDQAIRSEDLSVAGLTVDLNINPRLYENFDLFINACQIDGQIVVQCQYNTGLIDGGTVRRWLELYREALTRAVAEPAQTLGDAFAPTADDVARIAQFNQSARDFDRQLSVHARFEQQVARSPNSIAATAGGATTTYSELNSRANGIAHALMSRGVKPGDLVGLSCGRNVHMLAAQLGILKAGAGYVPMDPSFPTERLDYMRTHSAARIIVSDASVAGTLPAGDAELLLADEIGAREELVSAATGPNDVCYVIYTSGSTGKPKGVRVPHGAVGNLIVSMAETPGMSAGDILLAVTTLSFDIAVAETLLPLSVGAKVVIADRDQAMDGDQLRTLIEAERVDVFQATPSTWRLLIGAGWMGRPTLKALCGGEPLPADLARSLLERAGEVWNCYGPTETTVWSSFHRVDDSAGAVPIGRPAANTQLHIVDETLRPVPVGVVGEIFIGGDGVTLGYHERPDLTAERFLPDPHRPGKTWYKTGDLGRWRADGVMECLGRTDHQVKVRGYRIELGEIEENLLKVSPIKQAIVITREDEPGDVALTAYVVAPQPVDRRTVRDELKLVLPDYMVPRHVVQLDAIPLLPNGKIDRKSLPKPVKAAADVAPNAAATPSNDLERLVLRQFEATLKLPDIGLDDDFFSLGGHSLLAANLANSLSREIGQRVPLRLIFDASTVRSLAAALGRLATQPVAASNTPVLEKADQTSAPLTAMQEGIYLSEKFYPGRVTNNSPSCHRLKGPFDVAAFRAALREMMKRQASLRTFIGEADDVPIQRIEPMCEFPLIEEDLSSLPASLREAELMTRMEAVADRPIDIHSFPLFRAVLYRLQPEEHVFLFMPHHIIWDGWSFDLLYDEMAKLYPDALSKHAGAEELSVSYADFARWHKTWIGEPELQAQLAYWKSRFEKPIDTRQMPTDRPRHTDDGRSATEWMTIDRATAQELHALAAKTGATANLVVMSLYAAMLGQVTSASNVVLGMPVRGRSNTSFENVMGLFVNLVPIVIDIDPTSSLTQHVRGARRVMLDALANQDIPFERVRELPEFQAFEAASGGFQSMYSFQDARARNRTWGPLSHSSIQLMQKGSPLEFGLWFMDLPNGLEGGFSYRTALWDQSTAALFRSRLLGLIARAIESPDAAVQDLLAAPGDDAQAFNAWLTLRSGETDSTELSTADRTGPRTTQNTEDKLIGIWADLIGIDESDISPQDNFFDLGGTSMLALKFVLLIERDLGLRIEPNRMLRETLQQLAATPVAKPVAAAAAKAIEPAQPQAQSPGALSNLLRRMGR